MSINQTELKAQKSFELATALTRAFVTFLEQSLRVLALLLCTAMARTAAFQGLRYTYRLFFFFIPEGLFTLWYSPSGNKKKL